MGATPLWGGAREPKEEASGWLSEAKDQTLASSFGEGGAGGRSARECGELHSKALQRAARSHDLSESTAITIVPPKGAKGASASERGYRQGGFSRHRSALSCLQAGGGARCCREQGHHYCAPQGGEGSERQRAWV